MTHNTASRVNEVGYILLVSYRRNAGVVFALKHKEIQPERQFGWPELKNGDFQDKKTAIDNIKH